jgi:hypothetical protein
MEFKIRGCPRPIPVRQSPLKCICHVVPVRVKPTPERTVIRIQKNRVAARLCFVAEYCGDIELAQYRVCTNCPRVIHWGWGRFIIVIRRLELYRRVRKSKDTKRIRVKITAGVRDHPSDRQWHVVRSEYFTLQLVGE